MKTSLDLLAENPHCKPMVLQKANHDFPMRNADELNMILAEVFTKHTHDQQCSLYFTFGTWMMVAFQTSNGYHQYEQVVQLSSLQRGC